MQAVATPEQVAQGEVQAVTQVPPETVMPTEQAVQRVDGPEHSVHGGEQARQLPESRYLPGAQALQRVVHS